MVSIGSIPISAPKGQVWRTLDDRWAWICKECSTLNVSKTEPHAQTLPCPVCADREAKREQRRIQRQEEAAQKRWGAS